MKNKLKNDKYRKMRGGHSRLLALNCSKCGGHLFNYQKDGPGILKRLYLDRIQGNKITNLTKTNFVCPKCKEILGIPMTYKKEDRLAIRLFEGAVSKRITKL